MTDRPEREEIAEIVGRTLGPPGGQMWSPRFVPTWPDSYTPDEQRVLLYCADMILLARTKR